MRRETFFIVYREPQFSSRFKVQGLKFNAQQRVQSSSILPTEGGGAAAQSSKFKVQSLSYRFSQIFYTLRVEIYQTTANAGNLTNYLSEIII